jgi:hypothetical protein
VATTITFASGVASVSGANNGVMKLYRAQTVSNTVTDGTINNSPGLSVIVSAATASTFGLAACNLNGSSVACTSPFSLGNSPGNVKANVEIFDAYGNVPAPTSVPTITVSSANGNYTVTGSPLTVTGSGSPVNRSSTQFTVTHANNGNNSAVITVSAPGFTDFTVTVQK